MNITILSIFRNSVSTLERYFEQMDGLQSLLTQRGDSLHLLLGYGDSIDGTGEALFDECSNRFDAHLVDVSHGGTQYGSIEHPTRFKQLAYCGNKLLDNVPANAYVVVVLESDLIWKAKTLATLIGRFYEYDGPTAFAPMIMDGPQSFYDVFAFRRGGQRFTKEPPYHPDLDGWQYRIMPVSSAGSVLAMAGWLAREARFSEQEAIVGLCKDIYAKGGNIWLDPSLTVYHPAPGGIERPASGDGRHPRHVWIQRDAAVCQ